MPEGRDPALSTVPGFPAPAPPPATLGPELVGGRLEAKHAAVFETFVVPRYLRPFGELALSMIATSDEAQVAHIDCRTGYPDVEIAERLPGCHIFGCDPSQTALELARAKAVAHPGVFADYRLTGAPSTSPF